MDTKELVIQALTEYSCVTTKQLSNYIKRMYNQAISPASIGGILRTFEREGKVGKSNCGIGTHYWVNI